MSLSDLVGGAGLAFFPMAALLVFVPVFLAVTYRALGRGSRRRYEGAAELPLHDAPLAPRSTPR